jgi:hypothetical protein
LRGGDLVVQTTKSTLTANGVAVVRMLLAADKTAHYKEGTPVAGIFGVAEYDCATDGNGIINGNVTAPNVANGAGITYNFPSNALRVPPDINTGRSRVQIYLANTVNVFVGALNSGSSAATAALNNTLAGFILSTTNGVTTYTIDTNAAAADQCITIIKCDETDPLYGFTGGRVFFQFLPAFCQSLTGVQYATQ